MSLTVGARLGPYEVLGPLGSGGMGEVFRARDERLGRDVAIKVMRAGMAGDPERLARFDREARLLASLSHPNIAAVLGLETADGAPALVMELIEGPTLAERIQRGGPLPPLEAFTIARKIAEALESAHERGIVHRDLKPANVKLTPDGGVKVLDFGLAKALLGEASGAGAASQLTHSPTVTLGTQHGVLLGTAAYMAPEQARGKAVDKRADIWAFGAVLYEMLTGRQLFAGETVSDTIAAILERSPDWTALPIRTPARVKDLLRRCLEKDAKQRLRDIGDARIELEAVLATAASGTLPAEAAPPDRARGLALWAIPVMALVALAAGYALRGWLAPNVPPVLRVSIVPPSQFSMRAAWFIGSGREIFGRAVVNEPGGKRVSRLYRRKLDRFDWEPVPGTEGSTSYDFSHDRRWLYVIAPIAEGSRQLQLLRMPLEGNTLPTRVMGWDPEYGEWDVLKDGRVVVRRRGEAGYAVLTPGRNSRPEWKPYRFEHKVATLGIHESLGSNDCLVVVGYYAGTGWNVAAAVLTLDTGEIRVLEPNTGSPRLLPSGTLVMTRNNAVLAAPYDARGRKLAAEPITVFDGLRVQNNWEHGAINVSETGDLVYAPGSPGGAVRSIQVLAPDGRETPWNDERRAFELPPALSPDGRTVLVVQVVPGAAIYELMRMDRGRPGAQRFMAYPGEDCTNPCFTPDGKRVAFLRQGIDSLAGLYVAPLDHSSEPLRILAARGTADYDAPYCWTADGRSILVNTEKAGISRIRVVSATPGEAGSPASPEVHDLIGDGYPNYDPEISPDGQRIAYASLETGTEQVMVASFDGRRAGPPVAVSRTGGFAPNWADGGRTLVFSTPQRVLMRSTIGDGLEPSVPEVWRDISNLVNNGEEYDLDPAGNIVLLKRGENESDVKQFNVVMGFEREVRAALARADRGRR